MRKLIPIILFIASAFLLVWILKTVFPKNAGVLNLFFILVLLDLFLWIVTRQDIRKLRNPWRTLLMFLYWLPSACVVTGVVLGFIIPFNEWNIFLRSFGISFVFIAYLGKLIPAVAMMTGYLIRGAGWLVFRLSGIQGKRAVSLKYVGQAGWLTGILLFLVLLSGMVFWEHNLKIRRVEIRIDDLPDSFRGMRIVQISDLHLGSWTAPSRLQEAVDSINRLDPDLVFVTGDLCNYTSDEVMPFVDILREIRPRIGVYAVLGNHDYGDYLTWDSPEKKEQNMILLKDQIRDLGWILLRNQHVILKKNGDSIAVIGVENWGSERRFQRLADLPAAREGVEGIAVMILLSHDPSYFDSIIVNQFPDIDLTFSGHTHGGQAGFESDRFRWSLSQYLYPRWAGLYTVEHPDKNVQYLYVNRGLGTIGYAGRVGIWPEITVADLK
jgi:predicted MPP superfamily phosphohydrolase